ncbi:hypothetical protein ACFSX5_06435 [Devosia albogilva]|uniref:Uncharacterized protein n=1 Tax=Devosia albogilva TaxID=429726 RepID=A0ABW5QIJ6_9HYPH
MMVLNRARRRRYVALFKAALLMSAVAVLATPKVELPDIPFPLVTAAQAAQEN